MPRSKGFLPDLEHPETEEVAKLLLETEPTQATPSLYRFRQGKVYQDGVNGCTGAAAVRTSQLILSAAAIESDLGSWLWAYIVGRLQAYRGMDPDEVPPLEDIGARPQLVLQALRDVGMVAEKDFASLYANRNSKALRDAATLAYDTRGLEWYTLTASDRYADVRQVLMRQQGFIFAMPVDTAFEANQGELITSINENDIIGYHMLSGLEAVSDDELRFDNWWRDDELGDTWGAPDGTGRMSVALFQSSLISNVLAVTHAPTLRRAA